MTGLADLWLPILLSAVFAFILSSLIHMAPLWHRNDYPGVANQDALMDAMRPFNLAPGDYMVPRTKNMSEYKTAEFQQKLDKGPLVVMTVMRRDSLGMGRALGLWFVFLVVVSIFAAYIAGRALPPGAAYLDVFRFAGATAFIAHATGVWPMSIWYHRAWSMTVKSTFDGLLYALVVGGTFGWLWPN